MDIFELIAKMTVEETKEFCELCEKIEKKVIKREKLNTIIERHIIDGASKLIKKTYIPEMLTIKEKPESLEKWFKKELKAKKILKYQKDECSFNWIVWYI